MLRSRLIAHLLRLILVNMFVRGGIAGDSVSIGYTPKIAAHMAPIALVQHSPWDVRDGGAEETAYGVACLKYMLHSPGGVLLKPDVISKWTTVSRFVRAAFCLDGTRSADEKVSLFSVQLGAARRPARERDPGES
eukprot:SAG22_NODE_162_length_16848_cov_16.978267_3_plen_135_part_00